jgi:four helix bundle protein
VEVRNYKDLQVWQKSRQLVSAGYQITQTFSKEEQFGLASQLRRALISIPSNIAEGHSRHSTKDYVNFLSIAIGSLAEVETQFILACDLRYANESEMQQIYAQIFELQKMLHAIRKKLKSPNPQSPIPNP